MHLLTELKYSKSVSFQWVPSRVGILGNEEADRIAKQASLLPFQEPDPIMPFSYMISSIKLKFHKQWIHDWEIGNTGRHLYSFQNEPSSPIKYKYVSRLIQGTISKMRIGHIVCLEYLHRFKLTDNPTCVLCNSGNDSIEHILFDCTDQNNTQSFAQTLPVAQSSI